MRGMDPRAAIRLIRFKLGYERAIERMCERLGFRKENLIGILNTLEDIADGLETLEDFANRLKYLEAVMKASKKNKHADAVDVLHAAQREGAGVRARVHGGSRRRHHSVQRGYEESGRRDVAA